MTPHMLLAGLVERIAACRGGDTYFTAAELAAWPVDFLEAINKLNLLVKASPATGMECPGCDEACTMPVEVLPGAQHRALIICDKRDDISRVLVPLSSLERRKSSGQTLAEAVAKLVGMELIRPEQVDATRWRVGQFQGIKHKSPLVLSLDLEPLLAIAGHTVRLVEVLAFKKGVVAIDQPALRKLVDNPTGRQTDAQETLQERGTRIHARLVELKIKGIKAYRQQVAKEEGLSAARITQIAREHQKNKAPKPRQWHTGLGDATEGVIQGKVKRKN